MTSRASLSVDVVSDVACPWCFIGQRKLMAAISAVPEIDVAVNWRPYQLDPTIPAEGMDRRAYMLGKFGSQERIDEIHRRIEAVGRELAITFAFDAMVVAANTLDAHRLIRWAGAQDRDTQSRVAAALFSANFEQGLDIGDRSVLVDIASNAGMDGAVVGAMLDAQADVEDVRNEIATAGQMGISGVPCFVIDRRYAVMGAQDPDVLADAFRQIAAQVPAS